VIPRDRKLKDNNLRMNLHDPAAREHARTLRAMRLGERGRVPTGGASAAAPEDMANMAVSALLGGRAYPGADSARCVPVCCVRS
jgi:hypothetical protein